MFQSARAQFKYVVKTSRSGKQGRKYIQVDKASSDAPVVLRKPVKKLSAKAKPKSTGSLPSAKFLPGNVGRRGKRGTRLADELAQSNSDTEIPETQAARKATISNTKPPIPGQDAMETQKWSGSGKRVEDKKSSGKVVGTLDAYCPVSPSDANVSEAKSRPQRRKRSMEERLPDFLMEVMYASWANCLLWRQWMCLIWTCCCPYWLHCPDSMTIAGAWWRGTQSRRKRW